MNDSHPIMFYFDVMIQCDDTSFEGPKTSYPNDTTVTKKHRNLKGYAESKKKPKCISMSESQQIRQFQNYSKDKKEEDQKQ